MNQHDARWRRHLQQRIDQNPADARILQQFLEDESEPVVDALIENELQSHALELEFGAIEQVHVSPTLHHKLYRIPQLEKRKVYLKWVGKLSALAAVLLILVVDTTPNYQNSPDVEKARRELAVAMKYLHRANVHSQRQIRQIVGGGVEKALRLGVFHSRDKS